MEFLSLPNTSVLGTRLYKRGVTKRPAGRKRLTPFFLFSFIISLSRSFFLLLFRPHSDWTASLLPPELLWMWRCVVPSPFTGYQTLAVTLQSERATCHGATSLFRKEITFTVDHAFFTWWLCELLIREKLLGDWLIDWLIGRLVKFTRTSSSACRGVVTHLNKCRQ